MKKHSAVYRTSVRGTASKTLALIAAFAIFAFNHGGLMSGLRSAPPVYYAESSEGLCEKLNGCFAGAECSVAAMGGESEALSGSVSFRLFGRLTLKRVPVRISERAELIPGGDPVGLSIYTRGVLIVGTAGFTNAEGRFVSPAEKAGLRPGDAIRSVNGTPVDSSLELQEAVDISSGVVEIDAERDGRSLKAEVTPERDTDGRLRIGAWVRDSTVGIGTLSFTDPGTGTLAALGHAVIDADTGTQLPVSEGRLVAANVLGVTKGRQGAPGELHGTFGSESPVIGSIWSNTELGVFGSAVKIPNGDGGVLPVAFPDEVHTGSAVLLSGASGIVEEYSCRIVKTGRQNEPAPKGLVIEIDDERLLELTGGIVQGMSGSPIIQDGRLVGAVTHVFVNDPQKGFGAYAYWMYMVSGGEKR